MQGSGFRAHVGFRGSGLIVLNLGFRAYTGFRVRGVNEVI